MDSIGPVDSASASACNQWQSSFIAAAPASTRRILLAGLKGRSASEEFAGDVSVSKTIKMLAAVQGSSTSFRGFSLFELELLARITSVFRCEQNQKVRRGRSVIICVCAVAHS
jgi:hypothetical protein